MPQIPLSVVLTTGITTLTGLLVTALYRRLVAYITSSGEWRSKTDKKLDALTDATQTTMRTELLHLTEKYLTRGWITPEERAALHDMHRKYSALEANGYIDGYMHRVDQLPDREI